MLAEEHGTARDDTEKVQQLPIAVGRVYNSYQHSQTPRAMAWEGHRGTDRNFQTLITQRKGLQIGLQGQTLVGPSCRAALG